MKKRRFSPLVFSASGNRIRNLSPDLGFWRVFFHNFSRFSKGISLHLKIKSTVDEECFSFFLSGKGNLLMKASENSEKLDHARKRNNILINLLQEPFAFPIIFLNKAINFKLRNEDLEFLELQLQAFGIYFFLSAAVEKPIDLI